jgi:hypothetical protein
MAPPSPTHRHSKTIFNNSSRLAAALLALLCLGTAFGVHLPIGDQANMINFYKNLDYYPSDAAGDALDQQL